MARRRFFVDEVHSGQAHVAGEHAYHLTRVLRVERGQKFELSDNHNVYLAEVETARQDLVSFVILEQFAPAEPAVSVALFAALIKFERFEWLIEKVTELGVESITPVMAERSEKGLDRAVLKRIARWRKIAREASEQSRRARIPEIDLPLAWDKAAAAPADYRYVLDEDPLVPPILAEIPAVRTAQDRIALLVGPEGGWTDRERASLASDWRPVGLGSTVLRAETAAIAGMAIIAAAWNIGSPVQPVSSAS